jgi:uncharacterized membrane protein
MTSARAEAAQSGSIVARAPSVDDRESRITATQRPQVSVLVPAKDEAENLPLFMENIESVRIIDGNRSHWKVKAPADTTVEWDSLITEDVPGEVIAWRSDEKASIANSGRIEFHDSTNGRGTIVTATIAYDPPAGALGKLVAKAARKDPNAQARHDLRRFKQLAETGEISTSERPAEVA